MKTLPIEQFTGIIADAFFVAHDEATEYSSDGKFPEEMVADLQAAAQVKLANYFKEYPNLYPVELKTGRSGSSTAQYRPEVFAPGYLYAAFNDAAMLAEKAASVIDETGPLEGEEIGQVLRRSGKRLLTVAVLAEDEREKVMKGLEYSEPEHLELHFGEDTMENGMLRLQTNAVHESQVVWSQGVRKFIKANRQADRGCPAAYIVTQRNGLKQKLIHAFWHDFVTFSYADAWTAPTPNS